MATLAVAVSCSAHLALLTPAALLGGGPFDEPPPRAIAVDIVPADEVPTGADGAAAAPEAMKPDKTPDETKPEAPKPAAPAAFEAPRPAALPAAAGAAWQSPPPGSAPAPARPAPPQAAAQPSPSSSAGIWAAPPFALPPSVAGNGAFMAPPDASGPGEAPAAAPLTGPAGIAGGGRAFDQVAAAQASVAGEVAAAFFDHLRTCSVKPTEVSPTARVVVRVYFNPDGSLAAGLPQNPAPLKVSQGGGELFVNVVAAVRNCQPYTMLPRDQYPEWRTLDLTFTARNF